MRKKVKRKKKHHLNRLKTRKAGNKPKTSSQGKSQSKASDSKSSSDNKKTVGIAVAVVVAAIVIIIIMVVVINSNNKKSYSYNYDKGMNCFESGDYQGCKSYFENALNTAAWKTPPQPFPIMQKNIAAPSH